MGENSKIEWTDHTFNPWIGCTKVSPGCANCYAEAQMDHRWKKVKWGPGQRRVRTSPANWRKPLAWNEAAKASGTRPRVFCASLADVFDPEVPIDWFKDLLQLIDDTQHLDWLLLTKRPELVRESLVEASNDGIEDFRHMPNVWLGTTVEGPAQIDRVRHLQAVQARVRFLSMEPLLARTSLSEVFGLRPGHTWEPCLCAEIDPSDRPCLVCESRRALGEASGIHWVIVGGESGDKARPMHPDWARQLRDECQAAGVAFHFKQWGEHLHTADLRAWGGADRPVYAYPQIKDGAGGLWSRVGKHAAGRLLDGRTWDEVPRA